MKLFYSRGACSLAPHIVLAELNMVYEVEAVDLNKKSCVSGDFLKINAKGSIPVLRMENGEFLTEGQVISQYLADQKPESNIYPKFGTTERYRCQEWMNFVATEIHKGFSPLFGAERLFTTDAGKTECKTAYKGVLTQKLNYLSETMGENDFLMGKTFTIADAYLFTCLSWSKHVGLDLNQWKNITTYMERVGTRPAVIRAMKEEGML